MKTFFIKLCILAMSMISALPMSAYDFMCGAIEYSIVDREARTCRIDKYHRDIKDSNLKDSLNSKCLYLAGEVSDGENVYKVVEIGDMAFKSSLINLFRLPSTIKRIGKKTFSNNTLLEINLPEGLEEIGDSAFWNCSFNRDYFFEAPQVGQAYLKIPDSVIKIGKSAFQEFRNSTITNLPPLLTVIEDYTFYNCKVKDMTLPKNLTSIGKYPFYGSDALEMEIPSGVTFIGEGAFQKFAFSSIKLPPNITVISDRVFKECHNLRNVEIPSGITSIGAEAFAYTRLNSIEIPDKVTHLGDSAFASTLITSIKLPATLTTLPSFLFFNCSKLTSVDIPESVTSIGSSAFAYTALESVKLPASLTEISSSLFDNCTKLSSIDIPKSVTSIGDSAFSCTSLMSIKLSDNITHIGEHAFEYCKLTDVELPSSLTDVPPYLFSYCTKLVSAVIPGSVKYIREYAFRGCQNLQYVATPDYITTLPTKASRAEDGYFMLPEGLLSIDEYAFAGCGKLQTVTIPASVENLANTSFVICNSLRNIYVSMGNKFYKDIDGVLTTIEGDCILTFPAGKSDSYIVPESITQIFNFAFRNNNLLKGIYMHDGVTDIGPYTFLNCSSLREMKLSNSLERIDTCTFAGCESLAKLSLPESVRTIAYGAFRNCSSLQDIEWNNSIMTIESEAFKDVPVRNIIFPYSLKEVGYNAFSNVDNVETIKIYGTFDYISFKLPYKRNESIYYLSDEVQGNYLLQIRWNFNNDSDVTLYVLNETYDEIVNGDYEPWSQFQDIRIYDPTGDPYFSSVDTVSARGDDDIDMRHPVEVYTLGGIRVADSVESLASGIYVLRQGNRKKKLAVK